MMWEMDYVLVDVYDFDIFTVVSRLCSYELYNLQVLMPLSPY